MGSSPFDLKSNLDKTREVFKREDILLRIKIFFGYNILMSIYYIYLVFVAITSELWIPAIYILFLGVLSFWGILWLANFRNLSRQVFLIFSIFDFFAMAILSSGNIIILFNVIYRIWILGVNKKSLRFFT